MKHLYDPRVVKGIKDFGFSLYDSEVILVALDVGQLETLKKVTPYLQCYLCPCGLVHGVDNEGEASSPQGTYVVVQF